MIPKKIHYMWFGGKPLPEDTEKYIKSWRKYCPDYEIKRWDESNFDIHCCKFVEEAYQEKKWAFVVDYVRFWALYHEGGVYIETDTELIKPIDLLLTHKAFFGRARETMTLPMIGLQKGAQVAKDMMDLYEAQHFVLPDGKLNTKTVNENLFEVLIENYGLNTSLTNDIQILKDDIEILPAKYLYSTNSETGVITMTPEMVVIHHAAASWLNKDQKMYVNTKRKCVAIFGEKIGSKIGSFIYYIRKDGVSSAVSKSVSFINKSSER